MAAIASLLLVEVYDLDVFWNVAIGRDILATGSVPSVDRYTLAGMGHSYFDIHWLFQVVAALSHRAAGWAGVELLAAAAWAATLLLAARAARRHAPAVVVSVLAFVAAVGSAERFLPRPEIATFLGLALFWERLADGDPRSRRDLALLVAAQAAWANAHGLFVLGPFLAGCAVVDEALRRLRGEPDALRERALLLAALLPATVATPHGLGTWRYAWLLVTQVGPGRPALFAALGELSPTFGSAFRSSPAFWAWAALAALAVGLALAAIANGRARELPAGRLLAGLGLLAASLTGRRNVALFAVAAIPLAAELFRIAAPRLVERARRATVALPAAAAMLAFAAWPLSGRYWLRMEIPARTGLGVTPSFFPHGLPAFLDRIGFAGNVYNSNTIGGFYLFHGFPRRLPLTEGRWTAYDDAVATRILSAPSDPRAFSRVIADYGIGAILLAHSSPEARALLPRLPLDPGWRLAWYDCAASFWLASSPGPAVPAASLAAGPSSAPRRVDDAILLDLFYESLGAPAVDARIDALSRAAGFGWKREAMLLERGRLLRERGRDAESEAAFRSIATEFPSSAPAWGELATFAMLRGDLAGAESLLRRGLEADPRSEELRRNLLRIKEVRP